MKMDMLVNLLSGSLGALFLYLYQQIGAYLKNKRMKQNLCSFILVDLNSILGFLQSEFADQYITSNKATNISAWKSIIPQIIQLIPPNLANEVIYSYIILQLTIENIVEQDIPKRKEILNKFNNSPKMASINNTIQKIQKYVGIK